MSKKLISIVAPVFNEEKNILKLYEELLKIFKNIQKKYNYELIFVDDGSLDRSLDILEKLAKRDKKVKNIQFSRNFGKEIATTAGINSCKGDACIMIDADLQHPPSVIPKFITKWEDGAEVVIGVRKKNNKDSWVKNVGAWVYYKIINKISNTKIVPNSTDFRLLDRIVIDEFNKLSERNRMTRALIAWLGFRREFVLFNSPNRVYGKAGYSPVNLAKLAMSSFVSMSLFPLKLAGYLGILIVFVSGPLGLFIFIEKYVLNDVLGMNFSGPAILAIIILFLIGIVLGCLGLIALYIANIQGEVVNRPLYIIRRKKL